MKNYKLKKILKSGKIENLMKLELKYTNFINIKVLF